MGTETEKHNKAIFSMATDYGNRMSAILLADESPQSSELQVICKPDQAGQLSDSPGR